ncbi:hypothetical protein COLO4_21055 [Corchorus olitorius]|uniref:DUF1230 domain-containing protein n=1 Tax=Corchorus olitorius TaxID=93759 RepID=A0A1R3IVI5_9ROSI|nr:hypothetical protein COLO4_21055 [Corchorus olitorius]
MATTAVVLHLSPRPPAAAAASPTVSSHSIPFSRPRFLPLHPIRKTSPTTKTLSSYKNGNGSNTPPLPETECPVPHEQQPINEYQSLSTSFPFSWASGDLVEFCSRLFVTGASFALLIGLPVAWFGSVGPKSEPVKLILAAVSSGIIVVTIAVLRMYLGWAYVGNRLLSATVEYEETGWYDGQIWVKTAEVLARDRLLGSFSVKPVLSRLKYTLVTLAVSLLVCVLPLVTIEASQEGSNATSKEAGGRAIPGVYDDDSARSFEPDAFCGESGIL